MEQRIGSSSQPLEGAGFDPAFIPGLTSPVSGEPKDAKPKEAVEADADAHVDTDADTDGAAPVEDKAPEEPSADAEKSEDAEEAEESEGTEEEETPDGPVFEASDRRAKIVADHRGVRLSLDDQRCEFRWDEIGALETETPRFGKRFTVTVHTPDRRWYPIEIEATSRSRFQEWESQLDEVLDAYFEEGAAETETAETEPAETAESAP
ncbi:hypothetical protein E0500_015005 [Streptomyces sp. KM273126]|uniref:hypothetical protein n=1 Tax=Streptomyces sp. KM273126 TaxID=2545247 RepID=UPI00103E6839|nr:hypothetical protein [Streptomyces sp. KM273126]MBA2808670.1 hypothetical protein [Streptomyces sp. KM273126]